MENNINLITTFYLDSLPARQEELRDCLHRNINNPCISHLYVLLEEGADNEPLLSSPKVTSLPVPKGRQTYADLVAVANKYCLGGIVILANSDIFFDQTITVLSTIDMTDTLFVLTRKDLRQDRAARWSFHQISSDAWAMRAPISTEGLKIELGKMGCESLFVGRMFRAGYAVKNISLDVACYHLHTTEKRNYNSETDRYAEESEMAFPMISGIDGPRPTNVSPDRPIVIDGSAFSESAHKASFWQNIIREWRDSSFGRELIVLNRGFGGDYDPGLRQSVAPPLNNYMISSVREVNGELARRLGASVFLSTGESTALGVPSVVLATTVVPENTHVDLDRYVFSRGLSYQMADYVLCAAKDIRDVLERRYHHRGESRFFDCPIWYGVRKVLACMQVDERAALRQRLALKSRFVVYAGDRVNSARTTNLRVVADALRRVKLGIVFIGGALAIEPETRLLFDGIEVTQLSEDSPDTILALAAAECFVVPQLGGDEGEWAHVALAAGCPLVRASWSQLHRDGGGTLYFSPVSLVSVLEFVMGQERDRFGRDAVARVAEELKLSNAERLALFLSAIRSGQSLPVI